MAGGGWVAGRQVAGGGAAGGGWRGGRWWMGGWAAGGGWRGGRRQVVGGWRGGRWWVAGQQVEGRRHSPLSSSSTPDAVLV